MNLRKSTTLRHIFLGGSVVENLLAKQEMQVWSLGREDPLEKGMATHFSTLAWEIPWTEEPGGPQFTGPQRFGHDRVTKQQQQHAKTSSRERAYGSHRDLGGTVRRVHFPGSGCPGSHASAGKEYLWASVTEHRQVPLQRTHLLLDDVEAAYFHHLHALNPNLFTQALA